MGNKKSKILTSKTIHDLQKVVDFNEEEIRFWYDQYRSSCKDKRYLTVSEFTNVYSNAYGCDASEFAEHLFRTFDINKNGKVDFKEFLIGLSVSSSNDVKKKLQWAFSMYDIDGNGNITPDEMLSLMRSIFEMTPSIRKPEDLDTPEKMTQHLFKKMDLDGNGEISWREFYECAKKDPVVLSMLQLNPDT